MYFKQDKYLYILIFGPDSDCEKYQNWNLKSLIIIIILAQSACKTTTLLPPPQQN